MSNALTIAGKEIRTSVVTPMAYAVTAGFLVMCGFFFFSLLKQFNPLVQQAALTKDSTPSLNDWVIYPYYQTLEIVLVFLIPILTMRAIAEERRSGTFELLATSPLKVGDIVLGKFIGSFAVIGTMLLLSFVFPASLLIFADPEVPPVLVGFLGLILFALAFTSIGIAVSACTQNQTISAVLSAVVSLIFYVCDAPADQLGPVLGGVLKYLAPSAHTLLMGRGVITGVDIVYFLSVTVIGLFIANRVLDAQRWR